MSGSVRFCRAEGELAERAGALLDATPMAGLARLSTRRPAGLLASLRAEGRRRDVIAVRAGDEVVGVGVRGEKECFVDGRPEPATVGYLSGLRVREDHRGGLVLARGYRFLRELHRAGRARCYLTTVLESNAEALRLLGSGRAGLPAYEDWGAIETSLFSPRRAARRLAAASRGPRVRSARAEDRPAAAAFLRAQGPRRQFFPAYEAGDLGSDDGLLPGLGLDDLLLAEDAAGLAGCAGVWDPSRFKTWAVAGYGFPLGAFRGAANLWAAARGLPSWPAPGAAAGLRFLAAFCLREESPAAARALLAASFSRAAAQGARVLAWSLHERDPLLALAASLPRVTVRSRLFLVRWPEDGTAGLPGRDRVPYLETGAL